MSCKSSAHKSLQDIRGDIVVQSQGFVELSYEMLPNNIPDIELSESYSEPLDTDSIEMWSYRGGNYYHPTWLSHRCHAYIATFYHTGELKYLQRAEKTAEKLMSECIIENGAAFAAVRFRFAVHGDTAVTLANPWVSCMPQGELLSVMVRLFEFTENDKYLKYADRLFKAYLRLQGMNKTWFARIDDDNYYWIEEYPHDSLPGMTLNGFIAGINGIYDYYRVKRDPLAKMVYHMAITTLKHYLPQYRREGECSFYCLGHKIITGQGYHHLHVKQMKALADMTGDEFFSVMFERFLADEKSVEAKK